MTGEERRREGLDEGERTRERSVSRRAVGGVRGRAGESGPGLCSSTHLPSLTVSMPSVVPSSLQSLSGNASSRVAVWVSTSMVTIAEFSWQLA